MSNPKPKPAAEWVDEGIPVNPRDPGSMIRWVSLIQEDMSKCYETTEVIEDLEFAFGELEKVFTWATVEGEPLPDNARGALGVLRMKVEALSALKMPWD